MMYSMSHGRLSMEHSRRFHSTSRRGAVLALVLMLFVILAMIGVLLLTISYGVRVRASRLKNEAMAMAAAEAGYEKAIFCMSKKKDILGSLGDADLAGDLVLGMSKCTYKVEFADYIGARPVFRVISDGSCNSARRTVDVFVVQAVSGWDMGMCRIPSGPYQTSEVHFAGTEIINMKVHINKLDDSPDQKDIYITGSPQFMQKVEMGEPRYTGNGADKYSGVMNLFQGGIVFDQPAIRITDAETVQIKLDRFKASTKAAFTFAPVASASMPTTLFPTAVNAYPRAAVQIEFYTDASGVGMLRITNNCTVVACNRTGFGVTNDFMIQPGSDPMRFIEYGVYAYHYKWDPADGATPAACKSITVPVTDTYVTQTFAGKESEPGGQIFVSGNVVLGSDAYNMVLKGKLTIVAARSGPNTDDGHIWVADRLMVDGARDASGMPASDNPNVLGLIAQGVAKVIDPGLSAYAANTSQKYPGYPPGAAPYTLDTVGSTAKHVYAPVADWAGGTAATYSRKLPTPMVIEAAVTVGGGGWGAENVAVYASNGNYVAGGRRESGEAVPPPNAQTLQDPLVLRGTLVESVRGIVGVMGRDGFLKNYTLDQRLLNGVLPGNIWFSGKFVPAPAGWHDYRSTVVP
jgi:hypothetical protein